MAREAIDNGARVIVTHDGKGCRLVSGVVLILAASAVCACARTSGTLGRAAPGLGRVSAGPPAGPAVRRPLPASASRALRRVVAGGIEQTRYTVRYDAAYVELDYPGGDVPRDRGVCTDVVVRAFRNGGVDLQKEVHEDMSAHFAAYPRRWGLSRPDPNIDHRRVPNLMTFFRRHGKALPVTARGADYRPGDVVTWTLGSGLAHAGLVTDYWSPAAKRYLIVHNIGSGARIDDVLFAWRITGHYRYFR